MNNNYEIKYLKYKTKYLSLQNQYAGNIKNIGIYVGRFQPLHNAHFNIILKGLETEDYMIVFLGSANLLNEKNPYDPKIRTEFIIESIKNINSDLLKKLSIIPINNTELYDDWFVDLDNKIINEINRVFQTNFTNDTFNTKYTLSLYGSRKDDDTSKYIDHILTKSIVKNNKLVDTVIINNQSLDATKIRSIISTSTPEILPHKLNNNLQPAVIDIIINEKEKLELHKPELLIEKILTFKKRMTELNKEESDALFKLYKMVYEKVEKKSGRVYEDMNIFKEIYTDVVYFVKNNIIFGGLFSTKFRYANKISIILHDKSLYGKQYVYDILNKLLNQYGYVIEASSGVENILQYNYNLKPLHIDIVKFIFGQNNIIQKPDNDTKYDRKTKNYKIENKQLFGNLCGSKYSKSWSRVMVLNQNVFNGCDLLLDNIIYNTYNIFENVFTGVATLTYISSNFTPYNNLDSEAIVSNQVETHKCTINNIPDNHEFNIKTNGFAFVNLFELDTHNVMTSFLNDIKIKMEDENYILNNNADRIHFRKSLEIFCNYLMKEHKNLFGDILQVDYDTIVCLDAVPRDTNSSNENSKFSAINLVHSDIYPFGNIGDILWSFRNTWYDKINEHIIDIDNERLDRPENRNKWNNKVVGIFNFWISLTDGITDNGLALLDFNQSLQDLLVPYKAFRPASKASDNVNFISSSIKYDQSHKWYTKYNMKFGECFIFNTIGSPHTGFKYDNGSTKNRKSIELRIMLLKNVTSKMNTLTTLDISSILPGDEQKLYNK